jgi:hypothetical protein
MTAPLFTPVSLRDVALRNRVVIPPMCQYSAGSRPQPVRQRGQVPQFAEIDPEAEQAVLVQGEGGAAPLRRMVCLHTGFAERLLGMNRNPDPAIVHDLCAGLDGRGGRVAQHPSAGIAGWTSTA